MSDLNKTNSSLSNKIESMEDQISGLTNEVSILSVENGNLNGQIVNLRQDNGSLEIQVSDLNEKLGESQRAVAQTPFVDGWFYTENEGWIHVIKRTIHSFTEILPKAGIYEIGSSNPRYFYNFNEFKWEAWESVTGEN